MLLCWMPLRLSEASLAPSQLLSFLQAAPNIAIVNKVLLFFFLRRGLCVKPNRLWEINMLVLAPHLVLHMHIPDFNQFGAVWFVGI